MPCLQQHICGFMKLLVWLTLHTVCSFCFQLVQHIKRNILRQQWYFWYRCKEYYLKIQWNLDLKVVRDCGNLFVVSNISILQILEKTTKMFIYIKVQLIINLQNPVFPSLNNVSVQSCYVAMALETQERANKAV